jgi:acetylornithine deacetylase/succinyl-diaminopimelate desuccinylase-like protein
LRRHGKAIIGPEFASHGVPVYTDARHYAAAGVPVVLYGAGPRTLAEANGHRADEKIEPRRLAQGDGDRGVGVG